MKTELFTKIAFMLVILTCLVDGLYIGQRLMLKTVLKDISLPKEIQEEARELSKMGGATRKKDDFVKISSLPPLQLILLGTVLVDSSDSSFSLAWIKDIRTGYEDYYKIGDRIKDACIARIKAGEAELVRVDGTNKILRIEILGSSDIIRKIELGKVISRYQNLNNILKEVSLKPYISGGKIKGIYLNRVETDSLGEELGFKEGDVVTKINGYRLSSLKGVFAFYERLKEEYKQGSIDIIEVGVERNGQPERLIFSAN